MTADDGPIPGSPSGMSRRRLLASLGGVGAVGMAGGAGTVAYFSDRETFASNDVDTGSLELQLTDDSVDGPVTFDVSGIDRGASGESTVDLRVRTNPARVWLATDCPDHDDRLAEALDVRLTFAEESVSGGWQSFAVFRRSLFDGLRLDDGCLSPDVPAPLTLHWRLPADVDASLDGSRTTFAFELYAEQCRHVSETDADRSNPFEGRVCNGGTGSESGTAAGPQGTPNDETAPEGSEKEGKSPDENGSDKTDDDERRRGKNSDESDSEAQS
ncbi:MAG: SipW-dependent-type signal peptide-containing protein [Halorubrum sp.]|uniref:SipW-dependent-type signal peptide-containing protein n=1 Tax=Halorubrum sp. TaxID=1879286 RepID=UPI0039705286